MKIVYCTDDTTVPGTCGVGVIYAFQFDKNYFGNNVAISNVRSAGGAGWAIAGFIDTPECKEAYEELAKRFKLIYQSPVRTNLNSGNAFFFCVYDASEHPHGYAATEAEGRLVADDDCFE